MVEGEGVWPNMVLYGEGGGGVGSNTGKKVKISLKILKFLG